MENRFIRNGLALAILCLIVGVSAYFFYWHRPPENGSIAAAEPEGIQTTVPARAVQAPAPAGMQFPECLAEVADQNEEGVVLKDGINGIVLVVADDKRGELMSPWVDTLKPLLPATCQLVKVLNFRSVSRALGPITRMSIKRRSTDGSPVYIDWKGAVAERYQLPIETPNIVCLNRAGEVIKSIHATMTPEAVEEILALY